MMLRLEHRISNFFGFPRDFSSIHCEILEKKLNQIGIKTNFRNVWEFEFVHGEDTCKKFRKV